MAERASSSLDSKTEKESDMVLETDQTGQRPVSTGGVHLTNEDVKLRHRKKSTEVTSSSCGASQQLPEGEVKQCLSWTPDSSEYQFITKTTQLETNSLPTNELERRVTQKRNSQSPETEDELNVETTQVSRDYVLVNKELYAEPEFKCPLCELLPQEPAKVSCCGHIFCQSCLLSHSKTGNSVCPLCEESFTWIRDKLVERKISGLQVYCVHRGQGCEWSGDLCRVEEHRHGTAQEEEGEGTDIERCRYQLATCKKCSQEMLYGELQHHATTLCQYRLVHCQYRFAGCEFQGSEASMPKHLQNNSCRHMSLLAKFVQHQYHRPLQYRCWILLTLAVVLATAVCLLPIRMTEQQDDTCKKLVADEIQRLGIEESIGSIEWKLDELHRKTDANDLAIQSLQYSLTKDLHPRLLEQEAAAKDLKADMLKLVAHTEDAKQMKNQMNNLQESIEQLKLEISDLKSGFTKQIDDAIKAGMNYFFPDLITGAEAKKPNCKKKKRGRR